MTAKLLFGFLAGCSASLVISFANAQGNNEPQDDKADAPRVTFRSDFAGQAELHDGNVDVEVRRWSIGDGVRLDRLPMENDGWLIVNLRGGELTTIIDGERQEREENDFWTVPPGSEMGIETEDDSAVIETIVIAQR